MEEFAVTIINYIGFDLDPWVNLQKSRYRPEEIAFDVTASCGSEAYKIAESIIKQRFGGCYIDPLRFISNSRKTVMFSISDHEYAPLPPTIHQSRFKKKRAFSRTVNIIPDTKQEFIAIFDAILEN